MPYSCPPKHLVAPFSSYCDICSAKTFPKTHLGVIWKVNRTMDPPHRAVAPEMMIRIEWVNAK